MRILFITYFYPPLGGIAPQRSIRLSRKLAELGVDLTVLTTSNSEGWTNIDNSLLEKIKNIRVIRTPCFGTDSLYRRKPFIIQFPKLIFIKILNVFFMDYMFFWNFTLFFKAFKIIYKEKPDFVYNSTPPFSSFFTIIFLKIFFPRLVVVGDFRDSFMGYPGIFRKGFWLKNIVRFLFCALWERIVLRHIDIFFAVSPGILDELKAKAGNNRKRIFELLHNGYDEADWAEIPPYTRGEKFRITYTGTFPLFRSPRAFFEGYARAIEENEEISKFGEILMVGQFSEEHLLLFRRFPYNKVLKVVGEVPYRKALEFQALSDVNLLILDELERADVVTGKIFEYMRAGRPILAIVPQGEAKRIIMEGNLGICVSPSDIDNIKKAILHLFHLWKTNSLDIYANKEYALKFEWTNLAHRFISVLEEAREKIRVR